MELFSNGLAIFPVWLGGTAIIYAWLCAAASNSFGMDVWFEHGEVFTVFFGLVGRFAPFRLTSQGLEAGAPARSLIAEKAPSITLIIFILFTLASTAIDGLKDTFPWLRVVVYLLPKIGVKVSSNAFGIAALFLLPAIFFGLYALAIYAGKLLTKSALRFHELLLTFGFSLVPISIAYHFAHYVDLLIGESQLLIPELSDPFGAGWNLFHTKDFVPNYIPIGANTIWYIQLTAIVVGHVIAAIIAHIIATRTFTSKRDIILSQIPMLVLMVFYTAFGLWILSQPFAPLS